MYIHSQLPTPTQSSKHVFERHLHDPWIAGIEDLAEVRVVESTYGIVQIHEIRDIEHFPAELDRLPFSDLKAAGQSHIDLHALWTTDAHCANRAVCSIGGNLEGRRIQPLGCAFVRRENIGEYLIAMLSRCSGQRAICS